MDELLQKLLESEVLTEETKTELEEALKTQLEEAKQAARTEEAANVRAELTEQWLNERDQLIEALDSKVGDFLQEEVAELKDDIERFRDLEAEYAEKLVEAKEAMGEDVKKDLEELVEKLDSWLEIRLTAEFEELREDIEEVRKNEFGRKIFEAFSQEFTDSYRDEESAEATLSETRKRLADTEQALQESETNRAKLERSIKLEQVLSPLSGRQKEVMEAVLKSVATDDLEDGYKTFIGRVVRETEEDSEKEDKVLAEDAIVEGAGDTKNNNKVVEGVVKTGNTEDVITESDDVVDPKAEHRMGYLKRLAGIEN